MCTHGRRLVLLGLTALLMLLGATGRASADFLIIGGTNSNNVAPFGITSYAGEYQQIYASSRFPGLVTISEIDFSSTNIGTGITRTLNLLLGLSTTSATPASTGTNYEANKGPDFTTVFSGTESFTGHGNGTFDLQFPITRFTYDPAKGNLLLDVVINSSTGTAVALVFGNTPDAGRVFNLLGSGIPTADPLRGLETRFTVTAAVVPDPSTLALFGLGGATLLGWRCSRKRSAA